jgi:uncharacterized membrane protein HdeD (DUF308 family)
VEAFDVTTIRVETYGIVEEDEPRAGPWFWVLLGLGIAWILLSFLLLQFTYTSVVSLAIVTGIVLCFAAASEFVQGFHAAGWRWVHAGLGGLFALGGICAFWYPDQTVGALSLLFGWYLLVKGTFDVVFSAIAHGMHLWWLGLIVGFVEIGLAFWCAGYPGRSAALLVLWVGIGALLRGITTLVAAFRVREANQALRGV